MKMNPDAKLVIYPEINKVRSIEELFGPYNKVIILYFITILFRKLMKIIKKNIWKIN